PLVEDEVELGVAEVGEVPVVQERVECQDWRPRLVVVVAAGTGEAIKHVYPPVPASPEDAEPRAEVPREDVVLGLGVRRPLPHGRQAVTFRHDRLLSLAVGIYLLPLARLCVTQSMVRLDKLVEPPLDQAV